MTIEDEIGWDGITKLMDVSLGELGELVLMDREHNMPAIQGCKSGTLTERLGQYEGLVEGEKGSIIANEPEVSFSRD